MNEYNHHRIIERVALDRGLDTSIKKTFIKASDFTDSIMADPDYFFYRNYYTIETKNNIIQLNRVKSYRPYLGMGISGEKQSSFSFSLTEWNENIDKKEFFSTVNERCKSAHSDLFDMGNQSDNVAFLHAMGAEGETAGDTYRDGSGKELSNMGAEGEMEGDTGEKTKDKGKTSRSLFEDHLKTCFAEYLFMEKEEEALFMLGIAFHGIMDSFTPSHMGFQKYTEQDMGLHAQGDVVPIMGSFDDDGKLIAGNFSEKEKVHFDPGQYTKEGFMNQQFIRKYKYFDGDDFLNPIEEEMFRVFLYIGDLQAKDNTGIWKSLNVVAFLKTFGNNKKEINSVLKKTHTIKEKGTNNILEEPVYRYGPKSYAYSEAAITVIREVYDLLSKSRKTIKSYDDYKQTKNTVEKAVNIWQEVYDGKRKIVFCINNNVSEKQECNMLKLRSEHLKYDLYSKKKELESYKTEVELEKSRARIYSPMY